MKKEQCIVITVKYMPDKKIKVVAFDLDNTLYNENTYFEFVINEFCRRHQFESNLFINDFYKIQRNTGDVFGDILKKRSVYTQSFQEELFCIYQSIDAKLSSYSSVISILKSLKEKSISTAVITNGDVAAQKNKIKCLGFEDKFDLIIYARQWGKEFEKPHPKSFEYLISYFSCLPSEILFVGDNENIDELGCSKVGIPFFKAESDQQLLPLMNNINHEFRYGSAN